MRAAFLLAQHASAHHGARSLPHRSPPARMRAAFESSAGAGSCFGRTLERRAHEGRPMTQHACEPVTKDPRQLLTIPSMYGTLWRERSRQRARRRYASSAADPDRRERARLASRRRPAKGSRHLIGGPSRHQELSISAAKAIKGPIILARHDRGRCERLTDAAVELQIGTQ